MRTIWRGLALSVFVLSSLTLTSIQGVAFAAQEGVDGDSYVSPTFGYEVSWDGDVWDAVEESSENGFDLLVLESDGATLYLEGVYFYQGDPDECLSGEEVRVAEDMDLDDLDIVADEDGEPIEGSGSDYAYALFELPIGPGERELDSVVYVECRSLVPNSIVLILTAYVDPTDVDVQMELVYDIVDAMNADRIEVPEIDENELEQIVRETAIDINGFWDDAFDEIGEVYVDPLFITFTGPTETWCGDAVPGESGSFYCPDDRTVYLDVEDNLQNDLSFGVVFFQVVVAHEIGHHVQELLTLSGCTERVCGEPDESLAIELQADCFAGAWMQDAAERGVINEGELERVEIAVKAFMGDPIDTPIDDPDAHGTGDERFEMFMAGYIEGLVACGIS